jgi:microcin C transport system substrate-binding protein
LRLALADRARFALRVYALPSQTLLALLALLLALTLWLAAAPAAAANTRAHGGQAAQAVLQPHAASHAWAQFGDVALPPGFAHFPYVNPNAPRGGSITLVSPTRITTFDKFNPFTLKGTAPPGMGLLMFESLLTPTLNEPTTAYGLLAESVQVAADGRSATFRLRPQARFHDGSPVLAEDVRHSFETLTSPQAAPQLRSFFREISAVRVLGERLVRFEFARANAELPLIAGSIPIFSRAWGLENGQRIPFDQVILQHPIASGPYRIARVNFGRDITYERDPNWWAADLNVRRGMFNFDRITYTLYRDPTAQVQAFKAGEFDYLQSFISREWARTLIGPPFDRGELIKRELEHHNAGDFQGFLINTRRAHLQDARVREALTLAMDFEWMNRQLFFRSFERVRGFFVGSDFEAQGLPPPDELALLEPLRAQLPAAVFAQPVPLPPVMRLELDSGQTLRDRLRRARDLLAEAGWRYRNGALRNAQGEPFVIEFLDSGGGMGRVVTPLQNNLRRLGIRAEYRVVDFALLQRRLDAFDFDLTSVRWLGSQAPGAELLDRFGSAAARTPGAGNLIGVQDPAVDALLEHALAARTRPELSAALRALDRVLRHQHLVIPHWYSNRHRIAWRAGRFEQPVTLPRYFQAESWVLATWWASAENRAQAQRGR